MVNQNPEQLARDIIDRKLLVSGWIIQSIKNINLSAGVGIAVREYLTDIGPADYVLFVDGKPVGVIEAKREEEAHRLTVHESQAEGYAGAKLRHLNNEPLPFLYLSTGEVTQFTCFYDAKPRSRPVFSFHRPETLREWIKTGSTVRKRLLDLPLLPVTGLRECQINAITSLEKSLKENRPRALIQMATGSGKTFCAITFIYRLLKYSRAKRVLFLVDTKNLGEQAEQEFISYMPNDDNRKFTELYNVQRLRSRYIAPDSQVCISTIQRLYAILKGQELDEQLEEQNPNELKFQHKVVPPVEYSEQLPLEFFDVIVIDECHRSIYNLWKQVLEYFDAFEIGLTATPDNRTYGYFDQNIVSRYSHEAAIADGVNVGYNVFLIKTEITQQGATLWKGEYIEHRERVSFRKSIELQQEDENYRPNQLDRDVVNPNQIRTVIKTFKEHLPVIFSDRYDEQGCFEVPKTLVFAKSDSHANDIISIIRQEFAEENKFCRKITYNSEKDLADTEGRLLEQGENPRSILTQFRNSYYPRIAVTVDMIATGTDVKPLECLLFMRDVKSSNYFEQMKGRGTRTITLDDLKKVTPSAKRTKDHFVIIDAVGVSESTKTDSRPLEKKPGTPLKGLLQAVAVGARDEALFSALANRLARLNTQLNDKEKQKFTELSGGVALPETVKNLLNAYDPDTLEQIQAWVQNEMQGEAPAAIESAVQKATEELRTTAARVFTGELNNYIETVRKAHDQRIDTVNPDTLLQAGWVTDVSRNAETVIQDFNEYLFLNRDRLTALQIFYNQPYRRRELTYTMIHEVLEQLINDKPRLAPLPVWQAYSALEKTSGSPKNDLTALVALLRKVTGLDPVLTAYDITIDKNFREWVFKKQAGAGPKFTEEQMNWLRMIKDYIANSFRIEKDDFDLNPFNAKGGLGKMWQLFGTQTDTIIDELNEALVG